MSDEIKNQLEAEAKHGLSVIITKVFNVIIEPILDALSIIPNRIKELLEERRLRSETDFDISIERLNFYCDKNNLDVMLLMGHNGKYSKTKWSFKYLECIYENIQVRNKIIDRLILSSVKRYLYNDFIRYARNNMDFLRKDFTDDLVAHFGEYNNISFRMHRAVIYIILSDSHIKDLTECGWIKKQIDAIIKSK